MEYSRNKYQKRIEALKEDIKKDITKIVYDKKLDGRFAFTDKEEFVSRLSNDSIGVLNAKYQVLCSAINN